MKSTYTARAVLPNFAAWQRVTAEPPLLRAPFWSLDPAGGTARGSVTVRLGSTRVTYRVVVTADGSDPYHVRIGVTGKEARGSGTIDATVVVTATEQDGMTVLATVEVEPTGRAEGATNDAWQRAIDRMLAAATDPSEQPKAASTASSPSQPPPRAPVAVAPPPPTTSASTRSRSTLISAGVVAVLLSGVMFRILRRQRRSRR